MAVESIETGQAQSGWKRPRGTPSLAEVFGSIKTRPTGSFWRKLVAFLGEEPHTPTAQALGETLDGLGCRA